MRCPSCGHEHSKVVDSRIAGEGRSTRRRRECEKCQFRFTTFEHLTATNLLVRKKGDTTEPYDREKLEHGILIACGKRPVSVEQIRSNLSELEEKWGREAEVSSEKIGNDVMDMLREVDEVAFVRFASVYLRFSNAEEFQKILINKT